MKDIERLASTLKAVAEARDRLTKLLVDEGWEEEGTPALVPSIDDLKRAYKALSTALDGDGPTCPAVHVQHAWEIVGRLVDELSREP